MSDLLPPNSTSQERDLVAATARAGEVENPIRDLWSPASCPAPALPWLAWALSVDSWDPAWTEAEQRETIARAIALQRLKGTAGAVRAGLAILGIDALVLEWQQQETPGTPFTYRLLLRAGANAASLEAINAAIAIVDRLKSLRSHLELVEVTAAVEGGPQVAGFASIGSEITIRYSPANIVADDSEVVMS
jgi:phage tail P2-like protein